MTLTRSSSVYSRTFESRDPAVSILHSFHSLDGCDRYLTEEFGADWYNEIDLDLLDMKYGRYCILGQLCKVPAGVPPFRNIFTVLKIEIDKDFSGLGFFGDATFFEGKWDELTALWKSFILEKRANQPQVSAETPRMETYDDAFDALYSDKPSKRYLLKFDDGRMVWVASLADIADGQYFTIQQEN